MKTATCIVNVLLTLVLLVLWYAIVQTYGEGMVAYPFAWSYAMTAAAILLISVAGLVWQFTERATVLRWLLPMLSSLGLCILAIPFWRAMGRWPAVDEGPGAGWYLLLGPSTLIGAIWGMISAILVLLLRRRHRQVPLVGGDPGKPRGDSGIITGHQGEPAGEDHHQRP
ncbi:MAG: hypothetical protein ACLFVU_02190 [Phycisphaerae bacterium]